MSKSEKGSVMLARRMVTKVAIVACLTVLASCGEPDEPAADQGADPTPTTISTSPAGPSATSVTSELAGTEWVLVSLNDAPIDTGVTITLDFTEDQVSGSAGCNIYGGSYTANASSEFSTTEIFNTEMGCLEPANVMDVETMYLEAFRSATWYRVTGGQLTLGSVENKQSLVYSRAGEPAATASPTQPEDLASPSPAASLPTPAIADATPIIPYVDVAPLDNPDLGVAVYWLGEQFDPGGDLPAIALTSVYEPATPGGGPADSRGELQYSDEPFGSDVKLRLMSRADWDAWAARDPATDDHARILHMFWDTSCAQQEEVELDGGQAVIYSSFQTLADPAVTDCPDGSFDRFLAHVFIGDTVVLINAPHFFEPPDMPGYEGAYNSVEGLRAVANGLQPREPVAEPTPFPTPAASLDDPGSLVLQPADLPGRYGYGDDGCSPRYECNIGPVSFGSEGGYGELQMAAGRFLSTFMQYEHAGFNSGGTPDPNVEPPRIDSLALVCVEGCDPAAILELGPELLRYNGHSEATEAETPPDLGDAARLYETSTLVFGQSSTGHAVVWRDGSVVGMVVVGGGPGAEFALELAGRQAERIRHASVD